MLVRSKHNPILSAHPHLSWCSKKIYNCAVYSEGTVYRMLFRGVGEDWVSRLGLAESRDGEKFIVDPLPVMSPEKPLEGGGIEDPRIVKIDGTFYVTYTAFDGVTARAAIARSTDLHNWEDRQLLFPSWNTRQQRSNLPTDWSKAAALFPQKIHGKYYVFFGDNNIWPAVSDDLLTWDPQYQAVLMPRPGFFDAAYIEMGPPPIHTAHGWLVLYHGIDTHDQSRTYRLGAALFDLDDPLLMLWRCTGPILEPQEPYEVFGLIDILKGGYTALKTITTDDLQALADQNQLPRAIFCCAAIREREKVRLYYSGGDTVLCTATIDLASILAS